MTMLMRGNVDNATNERAFVDDEAVDAYVGGDDDERWWMLDVGHDGDELINTLTMICMFYLSPYHNCCWLLWGGQCSWALPPANRRPPSYSLPTVIGSITLL